MATRGLSVPIGRHGEGRGGGIAVVMIGAGLVAAAIGLTQFGRFQTEGYLTYLLSGLGVRGPVRPVGPVGRSSAIYGS